jgi:hypothetical protein
LWSRFDRAGHELIEIEPATNPHSAHHQSPGSVP